MSTAFPKALFFDWDGTLVNTYDILEAAHNYALDKLGRPALKKGVFSNYFGKPRDYVYETIYGLDLVPQAKTYFAEHFEAHHCNLITYMAGADDLLMFLKDRGTPCALISNKQPHLVKAEVRHLGLDDHFLSITGGGEAAQDKPSPDPILMGWDRSGLDIDLCDIWYVGDSVSDLAAAQAAGMNCVYIHEQKPSSELIQNYNPVYVFPNCTAFVQFLSTLR